MIHVSVKHRKYEIADRAAAFLFQQLKLDKDAFALGPSLPGISRIKNLYIRDILLKFDRSQSKKVKTHLRMAVAALRREADLKMAQVHIDVDP